MVRNEAPDQLINSRHRSPPPNPTSPGNVQPPSGISGTSWKLSHKQSKHVSAWESIGKM